jgi:hypothetical protein
MNRICKLADFPHRRKLRKVCDRGEIASESQKVGWTLINSKTDLSAVPMRDRSISPGSPYQNSHGKLLMRAHAWYVANSNETLICSAIQNDARL